MAALHHSISSFQPKPKPDIIQDLLNDAAESCDVFQTVKTVDMNGNIVSEQWYYNGKALTKKEADNFKINIDQNNTLKKVGLGDLL